SDQLTAFNALAFSHGKVVHMGVPRTISEAMIDLQHFTVTGELHFHFVNNAICSSINWRADWRSKVDTVVHLLHLVNGVEAESIAGCKSYKLLIGYGLYR